VLLTAVVLATHVWVLRAVPAVFAPSASAAPVTGRILAARQVDATPVVETEQPIPVPAQAARRPVGRARPAAVPKTAQEPKSAAAAQANAAAGDAPAPEPSQVRTGEMELLAAAAPATAMAPAASRHAPATPMPLAYAVPGSVRLHYRVELHKSVLSLRGTGQLDWHHDGRNYEAVLEVEVPVVYHRIQRSTGVITAEGLAPVRFSDRTRSEEATHFQRDQGKVTFSSNRPDLPWVPGMQDRLSVMLQLGALIAGAPSKYPPGTSVTIDTAGTRDAEPWIFNVEGEEALDLPGGKVSGVKLTRHPRKEYDVQVELWLAPGMAYVPVRLRLTQPNGDWVDQQWSATDRG